MLSINKLEELLSKHGFIPITYFTINSYCVYIEVISIKGTHTFMLTIPSKYNFKVKEGQCVHKLKYIELETGNIADEYGGVQDPFDLEKTYTEVELTNQLIRRKENEEGDISGNLEEGYKRPISIDNISNEDIKDIKNISRQLKRLRFCVQSISYKLVIIYKTYMCVLAKDDIIDCYMIKKFPNLSHRQIYVSVDLELYYENVERIQKDISNIEKGIRRVMDKNQFSLTQSLENMLKEYSSIPQYSSDVIKKKEEYTTLISNFEILLFEISKSEKEIVEKLYTSTSTDDKIKYEDDLTKLEGVKRNTVKNLNEIKCKLDNLSLIIDNIFFDNLVMCDRMLRNLKYIKSLSR